METIATRLAFWKLFCRSGEISEEKKKQKRSDVFFGVKKRTWGRKRKKRGWQREKVGLRVQRCSFWQNVGIGLILYLAMVRIRSTAERVVSCRARVCIQGPSVAFAYLLQHSILLRCLANQRRMRPAESGHSCISPSAKTHCCKLQQPVSCNDVQVRGGKRKTHES